MKKIEIKEMNIDFSIDNKITCILGKSNSGKTYLLKKLINKIDNSDIFINNKNIKEYDVNYLKHNIAVVLDDDEYTCEYAFEELVYYLDKLKFSDEEVEKRVDEIVDLFKLDKFSNNKIQDLYTKDKILFKILSLLIINPKVLAIDNLLNYLDSNMVSLLFNYVKKKNITLIIVTNNTNYLLKCDNVIVLNDKKCILSGNIKEVINGNTILPYMGIKLPFIIELSQNLILYNLIDKVYIDNKRLVNKLWK